ncbi:MAG TPA: isoprenylcysteine carboxylmethyltransferase family protein, partial [Fimbriimonadaceae bacterium]|nr:isoprenylcysteine carboxylmethyltransferase family protein [Fimbriimonadaceae bacterium]
AALGMAFAVWARVNLGANWGVPMTMRAEPELVKTGPYRQVRHPIYTGILLALLGSIPVAGRFWIPVFAVCLVYFVYSAIEEEKLMTREFPEQYPEYRKRTKMFIPYVV